MTSAQRPVPCWRNFGFILLLTVLVRLPFFFPAVLDWDESSFILIGQSILNGHLPYAHLWDLKPPLLFAFFAGAIAVFGHSIAGIRFAGALCVATTTWFVYLIAAKWWNRSAAWLAAVMCLLVSSLLGSGQATMSEHVMLPPLMGSVYLWLGDTRSGPRYFWIGALVAVATLVRLNMAYVVLTFGILIGIDAARRRDGILRVLSVYSAGGIATVVLTCLPFAVVGQVTLLWKSSVVAALVRSDPGGTTGDRLAELWLYALRSGGDGSESNVLWLAVFVWCGALAGLVEIVWRSRTGNSAPRGFSVLALLAIATCAGIVMSGGTYAHYFIQLVPFAAIFSAALVHYPPRVVRAAVWVIVGALVVSSLRPVAAEYDAMQSRAFAHEDLRYGQAYEIASYLRRENPSGRPVLLMTAHLAYWLLNTEPPTGFVTHPSTLSRENVLAVMGTTTHEELLRIFREMPQFVVIDPDDWPLDDDARTWLESVLANDYVVATRIDGLDVYRRRMVREIH